MCLSNLLGTRSVSVLRWLAAAALALAACRYSEAQVWSANPKASFPSDYWCGGPWLESVNGVPTQGPVTSSIEISFNVLIKHGVHENFDIELFPALPEHVLFSDPPGPPTRTTNELIQAYGERHPRAQFLFVYDGLWMVNDCDGDGMASLGPGNPPCWGSPTASLTRLDQHGSLLRYSKNLIPGTCAPLPRYKIRIDSPPLLNRGVVGIRIKGKNAGYFLGMSAYSDASVRSGHAWIRILVKGGGFEGGPGGRWAYGKWPADELNYDQVVPWAPGEIRPEGDRPSLHTAWFPVTHAEYNAAMAVLSRELTNPSRWSLGDGSCIDFAAEFMIAAGCPIPNCLQLPTLWRSPRAFNRECSRIIVEEGALLGRCGYVAGVPTNHFGSQDGLFDAGIATERIVADPAAMAQELGYEIVGIDLGSTALRTNSTLSLAITRPQESLVIVDFGDGTVKPHVSGALSHSYSKPGSYQVRVLTLQNLRVSVRTLTVQVQQKASNGRTVACAIPDVPVLLFRDPGAPPASQPWARTFPADVNCDWVADGEDLALVLAQWGSTNLTPADIDEDGVVNGHDLAIVLAGWGHLAD
ncbi:MAG: hypothetical protein GC172_00790 [Phycisphaera sp.]|nr:hypothetical protein [Phycisphaera sp.]